MRMLAARPEARTFLANAPKPPRTPDQDATLERTTLGSLSSGTPSATTPYH